MIDRSKLALIHVVKKEIGVTDSDYRDILMRVAGVNTATDLDEEGFHKLMYFLVRSRHYKVKRDGRTLKQKIFMVRLSEEMGWDRIHLDSFIRKYYRKESVDELSRQEASRAIESLKNARAHFLNQPKKIA